MFAKSVYHGISRGRLTATHGGQAQTGNTAGVDEGVGVGSATQADAISTTMDSRTCTITASEMEVR